MDYTEVYDETKDYGEMVTAVYEGPNATMVDYYEMMEVAMTMEVRVDMVEVYDGSVDYYENVVNVYEECDADDVCETMEEPALSDDWRKIISFPGNLWVSALKLLVLPLIVLMMVILPSRVDEIGHVAARAVPLYLFTSTCAAIQGTIWAWIIRPGDIGEQPSDLMPRDGGGEVTELDAFLNVFYNAVPSNIVSAMANLRILGCICFFLTIGCLLRKESVLQKERDAVLNFSKAILRR